MILAIQYYYTHINHTDVMFVRYEVLGLTKEYDIDNLGPVRWQIVLCLMAIFVIVYFAMWKGVKSSGKVRIEYMYLRL